MASALTCRNCNIQLLDLEILRQHYKSEWHKFNLKRKIINQPPVTVEEFETINATKNKKFEQSKENRYCSTCRKKFNTTNQYENHLVSKKHKENFDKQEASDNELSQRTEDTAESTNGNTPGLGNSIFMENMISSKRTDVEDMETESVESVSSDEWLENTENPVDNNDCLFCNHHSRSLTRNLKHMMIAHTFFIPDPEYCVDLRGLLMYLGEKIYAGYMCIWCNNSGKAFQSVDAARAHMLDKGHCKMLHEGEALLEYSDFYDYSSSYPNAEKDEDPDMEVELPAELDDTDYQMALPSGNVIGHRALMRYYKQKLNPNSAIDLSVSHKMRKVMLQYRSLGWTNTKEQEVAQKARDIKYMQRVQTRYATQLQFKANKLQRYFRKQVMF